MSRAHGQDAERGASMVILLAMIAMFGLLMVAIGGQGQTAMQSSGGIKTERNNQYDAASAMKGAINTLRKTTDGRETTPCPNFQYQSGRVVVTCSVLPGSGRQQPAASTLPEHALLTTRGLPGYGTGAGIATSGGNFPLLISGPAYSNSTISVPKGLKSTGSVGAFGACTGSITGNPVSCNTGTLVADPGGAATTDATSGPWAATLQALPANAPAVTCNSTTKVASMQPGAYYDLSALTSGIGSCAVTYLSPGAYYFDFDATDPSNTQWTISNTTIGGTPKGWDPTASSQSPAVPGACYVDDAAHPAGVQLMFARSSRFRVGGSGALELCPTASSSSQQIVVYGRKTTQSGAASVPTLAPTGVTGASPATMGTPLANVLAIDAQINNPANGSTISGKNAIGKVTLTGFGTSAIPAGALITSVQVVVAHSENGNVGSIGITTTAGAQTLCTNANTGWSSSTTLKTDTLTCSPNLVWGSAGDAQVTYQVQRPNNSANTDVRLDGVQLIVTYNAVSPLRGQTFGTTIIDVSPGGGNKGVLYLWGTVYTPFGVVNVDFKNQNQSGFARGAVINGLTGSNVPPAQKLPPFVLPVPPLKYDNRHVELTAVLNGRIMIRSRVEFDDALGSNLGNVVNVLSWSSVQ